MRSIVLLSAFIWQTQYVKSVEIWDYAEDLGLSSSPLIHSQSIKRGSMARSLRPINQRLEFKTMGLKFSLDIDHNTALMGNELADLTTFKAVVGRNLKVTKEDGAVDIVGIPLASAAGSLDIRGGFTYDGQFYRFDSPGAMQDMNHKIGSKRAKKGQKRFIISRRPVGNLRDNPSQGKPYRCGTDQLGFNKKNSKMTLKETEPKSSKRDVFHIPNKFEDKIATNEGCPVVPRQLSVALVADCNYVQELGGKDKARENILTDMNLVSGIFVNSYNIDLSVVSIDLLDKCESSKSKSFNVPCKDYPGLDGALNSFSKWRDGKNQDAGIYHLVTSCNYSDTVGLAWLNQVCRTNSFVDSLADTISGTSITVYIKNQFSVMAHEMAHNLGAIHDCTSDTCDGSCTDYLKCQCCRCDGCDCKGQYIMEPESGGLDTVEFSACTIKDVCEKLPYLGKCIREQSVEQENLVAVCGNGIREGSEECDCGDEASCENQTCCTKDCKLTAGSKCSDDNDGCCSGCQIVPAGEKKVCKAATSICQRETVCDGINKGCPSPKYKPDGQPCGDGKKCASGICTSRDTQCGIFGRHLDITEACPYTTRSCSMICQGKEQCVDVNAIYVDGTPCGNNGFCSNGMCSDFGSSVETKAAPFAWSIILIKVAVTAFALLFSNI